MRPFLDSTDVVSEGPELQERLQRDGYLFIRGLLPKDVLEDLRLKWLRTIRDAGWVSRNHPLADGVADLNGFCVEPEPKYMDVLFEVYRLQQFHAIQHHPALIGLFERMWGEPVLPHPRIIGRTIFPQREAYTTPAHQDFIPIQGTPDTYTAWIPMADLPPELGGLQIAAGSHNSGVYEFRPALGAGAMEVVDPLEGTWVNNPFEQGDVLVFHSMTVHKGVACTGNRLRLSIDARFQKAGDPIAEASLGPHHERSWEEIYSGWPSEDYQYYWRQWDPTIKEYDGSYTAKRDQMAFELAAKGDGRALSVLQRIVARDPDPAKRAEAERLMAELESTCPEG